MKFHVLTNQGYSMNGSHTKNAIADIMEGFCISKRIPAAKLAEYADGLI
jgi:tryptophan synthase alpha subunit